MGLFKTRLRKEVLLLSVLCISLLLLLLLSRFSRVRLCATPIDGSPPGSAVPGILQARTLEWVAISFSNAWKWKVKVKSFSRAWLFSDPMDYSPPGSSVHGVFQARVLEWGAITFSELIIQSLINYALHSTSSRTLFSTVLWLGHIQVYG